MKVVIKDNNGYRVKIQDNNGYKVKIYRWTPKGFVDQYGSFLRDQDGNIFRGHND